MPSSSDSDGVPPHVGETGSLSPTTPMPTQQAPRIPELPWQPQSRPGSSAATSLRYPETTHTGTSSTTLWNNSTWSVNSSAPFAPQYFDRERQFSNSSTAMTVTADNDLEKDDATSYYPSQRNSISSIIPPAARDFFKPYPAFQPRRTTVWQISSHEDIPTGYESEDGRKSYEFPAPPATPQQTSGFEDMPRWRESLFLVNICLAQLFSLAGLSQSLAPLLVIAKDFHVENMGQMAWFTAAYSMTLGAFILPAGRLGDMFGHKRIFIIGWLWFAVWSMISGFSYLGGPIMLSACRGMQGIGPALLVPNGIALIGRTFPIGMKRAKAIAAFGGCGPVGMAIGVVFSSLFAELLWWPWSFWAMAIACFLVSIMTWFVIPPDTARMTPSDGQREHFDYLGTITGVAGLILINFALNEAPVVGWDTVYIPVLLGVGFLLMAAFVYVELVVARRPIVPLKGLHRDAAFTLACIGFGWASHGIWSYYLFLLLMVIRDLPPLTVASQFWPVAPVGFCAAMAVPYLLRKMRVPYLMTIAMLVFTASILLLLFAPPDQTYFAQTMVSILIAPLAMNWSFPSGTILMSNAVSKKHQGVAASLISTMVNYSIATGLGIAGTVDRYTTPRDGLLGGFHNAWWLGAAFGIAGVLMSLYFVWQSRRPQKC